MSNPASRIQLTNTITCCRNCVPPKRHTACWGHCPEYLKEKAQHEALKAERAKQTNIRNGLEAQKAAAVKRAGKGR